MKQILVIVTLTFAVPASAQTDIEIVNALLGQPYAKANAILSRMGVWYHHHYKNTRNATGEDSKAKFYSIENSDKVTKVWIIHFDKDMVMNEIVINFRHDDKRQVEDSQKLAVLAADHHIGTYSTDLVFKSKK